ncbi:uncharacterized protein TNIN_200521 [Trichonephila inaurata madagascariensis]|uniref:Uncharacterized protein n=1 Tax=Trichonephila inaurata madagascariensis TaxID=2747483 RepID=A0A8X7C017_9ARAC|nr:uncharacterized protein TNIN_200521 [Trichonephila inaurata madagascariensis]
MQLPDTFISLRHMSFSKLALRVFNDPDVKLFIRTHDNYACIWSSEEIEALLGEEPATVLNNAQVDELLSKGRKPTLSREYKHHFTGDSKDHSLHNKQFELLVDQKLSTLSLPNIFKKEVTFLVRLVCIESDKWVQDHSRITKFTTSLLHHFHWTQDNKIDRHKTAKAIVADDNIDIRDRFMIASHYCFQEDVFSIWEILDDTQQSFFKECDFKMARMWANWAIYQEELDWEEIARYSGCNGFGLQTYFPKLKREKRLQKLMSYRRGIWNDYHELKSCLSILDQNEQNEFLKKFPFQVLVLFLDWSLQAKLLDVVELLWTYLSERDFCGFLYLIHYQKRLSNLIGFDYVTLVKKLRKRIPFEFGQVIESDTIFNTFRFVLEYEGSRSFPHELRIHSNYNSLMAFHAGNTVFVISKYRCHFYSFVVF